MRITTQMLNASMRKAGIPVNTMSLLDCLGSSSAQNKNPLSVLNMGNVSSLTQKKDYETLKKSADNMQQSADKLNSKELFEEARTSGSAQSITDYVESLLKNYNQTVKSLKNTTSPLNQYYRQTLVEAVQEAKSGLTSIGITLEKDGALSLNQDKLKAADIDALEQVLGGAFTEKMSFLAERIADNAQANASSATSLYNAAGNNYFAAYSKYNFWS